MATDREVLPFVGVGDIRFGTARSDVRKLYGEPEDAVRQPNWNSQLTDMYISAGLSFAYDSEGLLAAVELFDPARVVVRGVELLGGPAGEVLEELRPALGAAAEGSDPQYFPEIGLSVALRGFDGMNEPLQSVSASVVGGDPQPEFFGAEPVGDQGSIVKGWRSASTGETSTSSSRASSSSTTKLDARREWWSIKPVRSSLGYRCRCCWRRRTPSACAFSTNKGWSTSRRRRRSGCPRWA